MAAVVAARSRDLRAGVRLELATIVWMVIEAAVAIAAGVLAGASCSPLLASTA